MNIINKKNILFFSLTTLMMNGCVAKNELETKNLDLKVVNTQPIIKNKTLAKSSWGKAAGVKVKKEDCVDCYAIPIDYSKPPLTSNNVFVKPSNRLSSNAYPKVAMNNKVKELKHFGNYGYKETASDTIVKTAVSRAIANKYVVPAILPRNSSYGSLTHRNIGSMAIQVGAFRQYSGAKVYANKYDTLSDRYKVTIKTSTKNNKPLHKVRIEGFKNKSEAKKFMYSYSISDGFLVSK